MLDLSHSSLDLDALRRLYSDKLVTPLELVGEVHRRIRAARNSGVWTALVPEDEALRHADALTRQAPERLPLFGVPFSVKDNIHVAGLPTTAGCPAFSHLPDKSATLVARMQAAGAILIGKNTMDQFATGLVGIRSPVHPVNTFNSSRIPGGSSSGSAVAVALGLVSIALGSDTGGSGRVPAALNNIVGFKPTPGVLSTAGMIYANRSFDCVPIFALTCEDAMKVFEILNGADDADPFQLDDPSRQRPLPNSEAGLTIGVPRREILDLDCDNAGRTAFEAAMDAFERSGARIVRIDFDPFFEAGQMVFGGPILAERYASVGGFISKHRAQVHPVVAAIIDSGKDYSAVDLVEAQHRLRSLQAAADRTLSTVDIVATPTAPSIPTIAEVELEPMTANARMGRYTYFGNPLGLCAVSVPAAMRPDGLPFAVCLYARKRADLALLRVAARFHAGSNLTMGATGIRLRAR